MSEIKKILIVTGSLNTGGAQRAVANITNCFEKEEIHVIIGLVADNASVTMEIHKKAEIRLIPKKQYKNSFDRYYSRMLFTRKLIREVKPDVIISFLSYVNITSCIASFGLGIPLIVSERSDPNRDPDRLFFRILRKVVYPWAKGYIFQTEEAKKFFAKHIQKKGMVIQNSLPEQLPDVNRIIIKRNIVAVGRLVAVKNYEMLIKAFSVFSKQHPEYVLEFFGDGAERNVLEEQCRKMNIYEKTIFHGNCDDVILQIRDASMFVLTSEYEGMPNALLEAMAMEVPCIATDCPIGGPRSLIEDGVNGYLVPVNDVPTLVKKMCVIAENPKLACNMGRNAGRVRINNSSEKIGKAYCDYINTIV